LPDDGKNLIAVIVENNRYELLDMRTDVNTVRFIEKDKDY
jgi:cobalamin-dependent methionine synthase I